MSVVARFRPLRALDLLSAETVRGEASEDASEEGSEEGRADYGSVPCGTGALCAPQISLVPQRRFSGERIECRGERREQGMAPRLASTSALEHLSTSALQH